MADNKKIEDQLSAAYESAPAPVRAYLDSGKFGEFIEFIQLRLSLSQDTTDRVSNELLLAILSFTDPRELPKNLFAHAKLDSDVVIAILAEADAQIFERLATESRSPAPAVVPPAPPLNRLAATTAPKLLAKPIPPAQVAVPASTPVVSVPAIVSKPAPLEVPKPVVAPTPAPMVPPAPPLTIAVPKPPVPQPLVAPVPPATEKKRPGEPSAPVTSVPKPVASTDPYREPVE